MGMPAKNKASKEDDRKPRSMKSFAALICAQPWDMSATELFNAAQAFGYPVSASSTVGATRDRYEHLKFETGDPPTWFVKEFLASNVGQRIKNFTSNNNMAKLKSGASKKARQLQGEISNIIDMVVREASQDSDAEAKWGFRADGAPKKKPGVKPKPSVEATLGDRQTVLVEVPGPLPPAAQVALARIEAEESQAKSEPETTEPVVPAPEQIPEPASEPSPAKEAPKVVDAVPAASTQFKSAVEEDDEVLQRVREEFEVGDRVSVSHPAGNGVTFTREGQITDKESRFATVQIGATFHKVSYNRLKHSPRVAGNGVRRRRANTNAVEPVAPTIGAKQKPESNITPITPTDATVRLLDAEAEAKPLKAIPPAFASLSLVATPAENKQAETKPVPKPASTDLTPGQTGVVAKPEAEPEKVDAPANPAPAPITAPLRAGSALQDVRAYREMGSGLESSLRTDAANGTQKIDALDRQIEQLKQKLDQLIVERDQERALVAESLRQADIIAEHNRLLAMLDGAMK